jgi:hypothetical protein
MQRYKFRRFNKELGFMQPVVTPDEGDMQFIGLNANNYWLSQADSLLREVVGNIDENPELLND